MDLLFKEGQALHSFPFRIVYTATESDSINLKVAFSVSKRNFKKAVHRNKIKRLMKETYRTQQQILLNELKDSKKLVHVFFLFTSKEIIPFNELTIKMNAALIKLSSKLIST